MPSSTNERPTTSRAEEAPRYGLAAWTYRSDELQELEYTNVFLRSWQFVCHASEVAAPGQYATLDMLRDSAIVVRDRAGELRAFKNVCRHRGTRLLDGRGSCKHLIQCPYHGWTYDFDGRLAGVPERPTIPGLDRGKLGLLEIEIEVFLGLVFVRFEAGGPSVAEMWGDYGDLLRPYRIEDMEPAGETMTEVWNCNWKTAVENNLENYHIPLGHPGYDRMLDSDLLGFMNEEGVAGSESVLAREASIYPTERMYQHLAPRALADRLGEKQRSTWTFFTMPPNMGVDVYPDSADIFQILPLTAETCMLRYPIFKRRDETREERLLRYLNMRINRQVAVEDKALSERVQAGLATAGYTPGPLSDIELPIFDLHERLRAAIPAIGLPSAPPQGELAATGGQLALPVAAE
ncbi:MAG: Rieske 2Fe-2S domain-containing protein [Rhizobiales bacterium]|nr:Rieske 2Fe-2S domain-containing protein [Hyphomicrobiales bacterium]